MLRDELQRIQQYMDRICAADGSLDILSAEEREDLIVLLEKWCEENEIELVEKRNSEFDDISAVRYQQNDAGMYPSI
jgi:hypothetical protein